MHQAVKSLRMIFGRSVAAVAVAVPFEEPAETKKGIDRYNSKPECRCYYIAAVEFELYLLDLLL